MYVRQSPQLGGMFDIFKGASKAVSSAMGASSAVTSAAQQVQLSATRAAAAIQQGQSAIEQGQEILTTVAKVSEDADAYLRRIANIPIEELARRFDYKSKIAVEELLSLSAFMKKALIYMCAIASLSLYLAILTKKD